MGKRGCNAELACDFMLSFFVALNKASAGVLQPVEVFTLPEKSALTG